MLKYQLIPSIKSVARQIQFSQGVLFEWIAASLEKNQFWLERIEGPGQSLLEAGNIGIIICIVR